jgi:hypothetical protein
MQPAPNEASQTATSVESSHRQPSPSNHGLQEHPDPASGRLSAGGRASSDPALPPDDSDALSVSSGGTSRGRRLDLQRLSSRDDSSHSSSPGSRIDEYERKHAKPRRRNDGMIFQVVPGTNASSSIAIEDFPNGKYHRQH